MSNELDGLAKGLNDAVNGKGGLKLEQVIKLLATENGKKILSLLMSDGGERVKKAAVKAKGGDVSGVQGIISAISETEEGRELLGELLKELK